MRKFRWVLVTFFSTLLVLIWANVATAEGNYGSLEGKTVRVIIASAPGESTDLLSRAFLKALNSELPKTSILVQNLEGGSSKAFQELKSAAGSDVITLMIVSRSPFLKQIVKPDDQVDIKSIRLVGSLGKVNRILAIRKTYPQLTIQEIINSDKPPLIGALKADSSLWEPLLINGLTQMKMKLVVGMSEGERQSMIIKGDIDGRVGTLTELQPLIDDGTVVPVLKFTKEGYPASFDLVPAISDFALPTSDKDVLKAIETLDRVGAAIIIAASLPDSKTESEVQAAFAKAVNDEEFNSMAAKLNAHIAFTPGEELTETFGAILMESNGMAEKIRAAIKCGQYKSDNNSGTCK
jgi:tripartite-type tricarboxylate transporter receptor subunit TctC